MQEPVEDGSSSGHVAQQLAPFLQWAVAGHDGGAVFVTAHDDLQQILPGVFGQRFQPHVINNDQIRLQISAKRFVLLVERLILHEIPNQIEDGTVKHQEVLADGLIADGLGQMCFADARRTQEQNILGFADELAGGRTGELNGSLPVLLVLLRCWQIMENARFSPPFNNS